MQTENSGKIRMPCVLVVDTSAAMEGELIQDLNRCIDYFIDELRRDERLWNSADLCVIRCDCKAVQERPFTPVDMIVPPVMGASDLSDCALNEGIITALDLIHVRKRLYRENGVDFWRPWLLLVTAFLPTDQEYTEAAAARLQEALQANKIHYRHLHCGPQVFAEKLHGYGGRSAELTGTMFDGFRQLKAQMAEASLETPCDALSGIHPEETPFEIKLEI